MCELPTFSRDGPFFLRPNHQDADPRILSGDVLVSGNLLVGRIIEFETEKFQFAASSAARFWRVFPDSRGEHERVNSPHHSDHGADARLQAMRVNVERQPGSLMALFHGG